MSNDSEAVERETRQAIDEGASNESERRDSQVLYDALRRHRDDLGGAAGLGDASGPITGPLSERILSEAKSRSAEIRAARRNPSTRSLAPGRAVPWWLILAWIAAVAAFVGVWIVL
jgi:hypothetical protein